MSKLDDLIGKACLCGSGQLYENCCQPYHLSQSWPATAEQLMRSRYVAYALGLTDYLQNTWAKSTRLGSLDLESNLVWTGLEIVATQQGMPFDATGKVHFKAHYQVKDHSGKVLESGVMEEVSDFVRDDAHHWVYLDGAVKG
ncbi:YchJ family protein [Hydrogenovibrio sp. JE_KL2]|uniref:YchJ family protein n=1 Tax=Hydrogenovibrio sp. JE_KL2 TaxID=2651188 RepID=UPI00128C2630|nr:YchJ family metal-binding protein [Hydrogenovibrio sp. JE_KL2]MPQ75763.1 hypothetical protein [Hydrogenovibrio sp. JE_KL2]